ncbi:hypothetical protein [Vasconcelosia minhoensis]|nr:hypothetical protein [Romeria gracilis]
MPESLEQQRRAIEADIAKRKHQLAEQEAELMHLQVLIPQLRAAIANHESILTSVIRELDAEQTIYSSDLTIHRSPMDMIRPEYKGMKLGDIAAHVLETCQIPLTTTELARRIYEAKNDDELSRARNSLSAELRGGVKSTHPRWQKIGRNAYASLQYSQEEAA